MAAKAANHDPLTAISSTRLSIEYSKPKKKKQKENHPRTKNSTPNLFSFTFILLVFFSNGQRLAYTW
jgi:hypothetical protein|tara:strand:+ start:1104 stop:1304 length:201 start_codon:yes stop_codon:yes gene_type:complete